jgi:energy-coupling factor transporter ATP-binding protein EcfA2
MRLIAARVTNYRSVIDSTEFEVEPGKTIVVGANEAGKTAVLQALRTINPPDGEPVGLEALRDYPRAKYTELDRGDKDTGDIEVARATFVLEPDDIAELREIDDDLFGDVTTVTVYRYLGNRRAVALQGVAHSFQLKAISKDLARLKAHLKTRPDGPAVVDDLEELLRAVPETRWLTGPFADHLDAWLERALPVIDEDDQQAERQFDRIRAAVRRPKTHQRARNIVAKRLPVFVYHSQYFTVRPRIHLASLAQRQASGDLDADYDFGNLCLLDLLGCTAAELSAMDNQPPPTLPADQQDHNAMAAYQQAEQQWQAQRDARQYRLNAASVMLTQMISKAWGEDSLQLRLVVDGQYLKVVVVDDIGVEVELDQRSEGFRWLVSFFVIFRAQAKDKLDNAILLLDEPGMNLHPLKQREFRKTVTMLAEDNQIIYTTHSPFMVGAEELRHVRLVEMPDRTTGTKVHTALVTADPRSVYPLQAALGHDLAQSMFTQRRNLVVEDLTDLWFIEGIAGAMREAGVPTVRDDISILPAQNAGKVVYYCTLLHTQKLKVAALLDSDATGERTASQDELVRLLRNNQILRTKDFYSGPVAGPGVEDLLRATLVRVAREELGWDITVTAESRPGRRIVDVFKAEIGPAFSRYKLTKAFLRWLSGHGWADLTDDEQQSWTALLAAANKGLA